MIRHKYIVYDNENDKRYSLETMPFSPTVGIFIKFFNTVYKIEQIIWEVEESETILYCKKISKLK